MLDVASHRAGHDEKDTYLNGLGGFLSSKGSATDHKKRKKDTKIPSFHRSLIIALLLSEWGSRRISNEAPRSKLRGILSAIAPQPYPPSLLRATARSPLAIPLRSKAQSILAKANELEKRNNSMDATDERFSAAC